MAAPSASTSFLSYADVRRSLRPVQERSEPVLPSPSASAAVSSLPPLHRHAVECILACLTLQELHRSLRACRLWLSAADSMRAVRVSTYGSSTQRLEQMLQSRLARHIVSLGVRSPQHVRPHDLRTMQQRMTSLGSLDCTLQLRAVDLPVTFPLTLSTLKLRVEASAVHAGSSALDALLASLRCMPLLSTLQLDLRAFQADVSLQALQQLTALSQLTVWLPHTATDTQVVELRALYHLHSLQVSQMGSALLRRLLEPPHARPLQWQDMMTTLHVDATLADTLPMLLSIKRLSLACGHLDAQQHLSFLAQLPHLSDLSLHGAESDTVSLLGSLCPRLTSLELQHGSSSDDALQRALSSLTMLRELHLRHHTVPSLHFLSALHLSSTLQRLTIWYCGLQDESQWRHIDSLQSLTYLCLSSVLTVTAERRRLLKPPSSVLPLLEHCQV